MQNNRIFSLTLIFISFMAFNQGVVSAAEVPPLTNKLTKISKPIAAPELQLKNMDDEVVDIKKLKGQVLVVNFWATWCPPCRREMGSLERLHQATKDSNVKVLAVNIGEDVETVFSFLGQVEPSPTFQMLFDTDANSMSKWKVRGLPTTYIVNKKGNLVYKAVGGREFDNSEIIKTILNLTKEK